MISINTSHIKQDEPYLLQGTEPADFLELSPDDPNVPVEALTPVSYRLSCSMAGADLVVMGRVEFGLRTICSRCCDEFETTVAQEKIILHYEKVKDEQIDLTNDIREELLVSMPSYFLCDENCKGICHGCMVNLNHEPCRCTEEVKEEKEETPTLAEDSPWKKLDQLKF